jgi:hypothetical protein
VFMCVEFLKKKFGSTSIVLIVLSTIYVYR